MNGDRAAESPQSRREYMRAWRRRSAYDRYRAVRRFPGDDGELREYKHYVHIQKDLLGPALPSCSLLACGLLVGQHLRTLSLSGVTE